MAFNTIVSGAQVKATDVQQIIDALSGVTGGGQPIAMTTLSDSSNYAVDIRNLDGTNGYGLRVRDSSSNNLLLASNNLITLTTGRIAATGLGHSPAAGASGVLLNIGGTLTEAASGTHARMSAVEITAPTITAGAGAVTAAASLYISGAPAASGGQNSPLWVAAGIVNIGAGSSSSATSFNSKMTVGLTVNQGANDDEALAIKSSDVSHGVTDTAETDTFGLAKKVSATDGGLEITGLSDAVFALQLKGVSTTEDTAKSDSASGCIRLLAKTKSGTGEANPGANTNAVVIWSGAGCRFIFDAEGSGHADVEWTTYDSHDDIALLNQLDAAMTKDPVKTEFGRYLSDYQAELQAAKIVNFYDPQGPRAMVNFTRLQMLTVGAVRQLGREQQALRAELTETRHALTVAQKALEMRA